MHACVTRLPIAMSLLSMLGCAASTKDLPPTTKELRVNVAKQGSLTSTRRIRLELEFATVE